MARHQSGVQLEVPHDLVFEIALDRAPFRRPRSGRRGSCPSAQGQRADGPRLRLARQRRLARVPLLDPAAVGGRQRAQRHLALHASAAPADGPRRPLGASDRHVNLSRCGSRPPCRWPPRRTRPRPASIRRRSNCVFPPPRWCPAGPPGAAAEIASAANRSQGCMASLLSIAVGSGHVSIIPQRGRGFKSEVVGGWWMGAGTDFGGQERRLCFSITARARRPPKVLC